MNDWIGIAIIVGILLAALYGLNVITKPRASISEEEFERRARENPGVLSAAVMGLQKILEPGAEKAVETRAELRRGRYNRKQTSGEGGDDSAPQNRNGKVSGA